MCRVSLFTLLVRRRHADAVWRGCSQIVVGMRSGRVAPVWYSVHAAWRNLLTVVVLLTEDDQAAAGQSITPAAGVNLAIVAATIPSTICARSGGRRGFRCSSTVCR
jgi:hypothetical protein